MPNSSDEYILTVGIETHVQLKTKSKLFSGADNNDIDKLPNSVVNHIDFGLPGALPVLNERAIELASKAAFALNSRPQSFSKFDRKHYFYPDLPMGYQISQYDEPIILGGYVEFLVNGEVKKVNITRAHLEADAGKSIHRDNDNYSLVDLNRAGTPLLEIVSEPELHSAKDAKAYVRELYLLMRYSEVSNANLFFGNMRFDVNVSVSKDDTLGVRTETKNLNSFRSVERAINFERDRQINILKKGKKITQETRGWDDSRGQGFLMRTKENADDYRYMPDPDLPPVILEDEYIDEIKRSMPNLPMFWRSKLKIHKLDNSIVESLIDSEAIYTVKNLEFVSNLDTKQAKVIANWIVNIELPLRSSHMDKTDEGISLSDNDRHKMYLDIYDLYNQAKLSSSNVKNLINRLLLSKSLPESISEYISKEGLIQSSDSTKIEEAVELAIKNNPKAIEDIKAGQDKAIKYLVGQVMAITKGQANPVIVTEIIMKKVGE